MRKLKLKANIKPFGKSDDPRPASRPSDLSPTIFHPVTVQDDIYWSPKLMEDKSLLYFWSLFFSSLLCVIGSLMD